MGAAATMRTAPLPAARCKKINAWARAEKSSKGALAAEPMMAIPQPTDSAVYRLYEPICCIRVACGASPAIVLVEFATGLVAAVRLRAPETARLIVLIFRVPKSGSNHLRKNSVILYRH
jgi:cyanate lyase